MKQLLLACVLALSPGCFLLSNLMGEKVTEPGRLMVGLGALRAEGGALPVLNARYGLLPRLDIGTRFDTLGWAFDTRFQYLTQAEHSVASALELGIGTAFISWFWYAGTGIAHDYGSTVPYFHVRYIRALVALAEMSQESNNVVENLYATLPNELVNAAQLFVGVELKLGEHWTITPEAGWVPSLDNFWVLNTALNFRF